MVRPRPMTAMVRVAAPSCTRQGKVVVQVEQSGGALLVFGKMQGLLGVLKEDVRVVGGVVEVEEAEG
jgi:hypothetical protein